MALHELQYPMRVFGRRGWFTARYFEVDVADADGRRAIRIRIWSRRRGRQAPVDVFYDAREFGRLALLSVRALNKGD